MKIAEGTHQAHNARNGPQDEPDIASATALGSAGPNHATPLLMRPSSVGLMLCFVLACGDSSGTGGAAGGNDTGGSGPGGSSGTAGAGGGLAPRGSCDFSDRVGRFTVEKQTDFGVVQGSVADGVVPSSVPEVVSESGGCRLLKRQNFACTPSCVGAETCGQDGVCIPYPRQVSVGTVTIAGLWRQIDGR